MMDKCKACGSENLFDGCFDADGYAGADNSGGTRRTKVDEWRVEFREEIGDIKRGLDQAANGEDFDAYSLLYSLHEICNCLLKLIDRFPVEQEWIDATTNQISGNTGQQ